MDKIDKKTMRKIAFIKVFLLLCSCSAFAQSSLDGTWKLDSVLIIKNGDSSVVEVSQVKQNPYFGLFDELVFQGNALTVTENGYPITGAVQISIDKISFAFMAAPIEVAYQINGGELVLDRRIFYQIEGESANNMYIILTKYKKQ